MERRGGKREEETEKRGKEEMGAKRRMVLDAILPGLLSHQFVGYLMKQDAYGEEGLLEYSSPKACGMFNPPK